jgi:hypothetical protein
MFAWAETHAARIQYDRVMEPDTLTILGPMRAVMLTSQRGISILGRGLGNTAGVSAATSATISNSGLVAGTFAGGFAAGAVGSLVASAVEDARHKRFADLARHILAALGDDERWPAMQQRWQNQVIVAMETSGLEVGEVAHWYPGVDEENVPNLRCGRTESCVMVATMWGLTDDARRIEAQTRVMLWSAKLRDPRRTSVRGPDFANVLRYRSAALPAIERDKTDADKQWLTGVAEILNASMPIGELIAQANSGSDGASIQARKDVMQMRTIQRRRVKEANARKWNDRTLAAVTARQWTAHNSALLEATLEEALTETVRMLQIELSVEGQAAKTRGRFATRDAQKIATVLEDGERMIGYLYDGTLMSMLRDDREQIGPEWERTFDQFDAKSHTH